MFELRIYDPIIGRWMATDPAEQYFSPYMAMGNSPINQIDPDEAYSKAGAWWRSMFHLGCKVIPIGDEYGVMFSSWKSDGNGGYYQNFETFQEGRIVFGFDGVGFEVGGDLHVRAGFTDSADLGGAGMEIDLGSVTMFRFAPHFIYEAGKGWSGSTWGIDWYGKNGELKVHYGGRVEVGGGFNLEELMHII